MAQRRIDNLAIGKIIPNSLRGKAVRVFEEGDTYFLWFEKLSRSGKESLNRMTDIFLNANVIAALKSYPSIFKTNILMPASKDITVWDI